MVNSSWIVIFKMRRITGHSITVDDIVRSEQSLGETVPAAAIAAVAPSGTPPATTSDSDGSEIRTLTFAELKALIEQGNTDQIPNNRVIPNELHVRYAVPISLAYRCSLAAI